MPKRPSLFQTPAAQAADPAEPGETITAPPPAKKAASATTSKRPPSRDGKRVLSIYLDPLAWKQLRQLALQEDTTTQALGEEAVNLLFNKHGLNRSA